MEILRDLFYSKMGGKKYTRKTADAFWKDYKVYLQKSETIVCKDKYEEKH